MPPPPHLSGEPPRRRPRLIQLPAGRHKVWLATLLAIVIMGTGQLYNRQYAKGLIALAIGVYLAEPGSPKLYLWLLLAVWTVSDARFVAKKLHAGKGVTRWGY